MTPETIGYIESKLREQHSPEQIAERMKIDSRGGLGHMDIRRYILAPPGGIILLRRLYKGSGVRILTDEQTQHIMDRLNNRPRK